MDLNAMLKSLQANANPENPPSSSPQPSSIPPALSVEGGGEPPPPSQAHQSHLDSLFRNLSMASPAPSGQPLHASTASVAPSGSNSIAPGTGMLPMENVKARQNQLLAMFNNTPAGASAGGNRSVSSASVKSGFGFTSLPTAPAALGSPTSESGRKLSLLEQLMMGQNSGGPSLPGVASTAASPISSSASIPLPPAKLEPAIPATAAPPVPALHAPVQAVQQDMFEPTPERSPQQTPLVPHQQTTPPVLSPPPSETPVGASKPPPVFHFISPFDAFSPPKSRRSTPLPSTAAVAEPKSTTESSSPAPPVDAIVINSSASPLSSATTTTNPKGLPSALPHSTNLGGTALNPPSHPLLERIPSTGSQASASPQKKGHSRTGSSSSSAAARKELQRANGDVVTPVPEWKAAAFSSEASSSVGTGVELHGRNTAFDVSKANAESIWVNAGKEDRDAVPIRKPVTIIKSDLVYYPGKTVALQSLIIYAMNRGRLRIIDEESGARLLLKLPLESGFFAKDANVIDIALDGENIACVTSDGGLVIFRIPQGWQEDETLAKMVLAVSGPQPDGSQAEGLKLARWFRKGTLALSWGKKIVMFEPFIHSNIWFSSVGQSPEGIPPTQPETLEQLLEGSQVLESGVEGGDIVSFAFDHAALQMATISTDSTLSVWSLEAIKSSGFVTETSGTLILQKPVPGAGIPSSLDFLEGSVVLGRAKGGEVHLVSLANGGAEVISSFKLVGNGVMSMFGKVEVDHRRGIIWLSNTARSSLFALRVRPEVQALNSPLVFDRLVEFPCEAISTFTISQLATVTSTDNSTDLQAVAVGAHGIDQVVIPSKVLDDFCQIHPPPVVAVKQENISPADAPIPLPAPSEDENSQDEVTNQSADSSIIKNRSSIVDEFAVLQPTPIISKDAPPLPEVVEQPSSPSTSISTSHAMKEKKNSPPLSAPTLSRNVSAGREVTPAFEFDRLPEVASSSFNANDLAKELKKLEDSTYNKLSQFFHKEFDRHQARSEDARRQEVLSDLKRQEKTIKLMGEELTFNTERMLRNQISESVLPVIEKVTRQEVKAVVSAEIGKGVTDAMKSTLPIEIERLLSSRFFISTIFPHIDRSIKELISETLVPSYQEATDTLSQNISSQIKAEMTEIRKEVITEQSAALLATNQLVSEMSKQLATASESIKTLIDTVAIQQKQLNVLIKYQRDSHGHLKPPQLPTASHPGLQAPINSSQQNGHQREYSVDRSTPPPLQQQQVHAPPPPPPLPVVPQPSAQDLVDYEDMFTQSFMSQDPNALRNLMMQVGPSAIDACLPLNPRTPGALSQAVILTTLVKFSDLLASIPPQQMLTTETFVPALFFMERAALNLCPSSDAAIQPFVDRAVPSALSNLAVVEQGLGMSSERGMQLARRVGKVREVLAAHAKR